MRRNIQIAECHRRVYSAITKSIEADKKNNNETCEFVIRLNIKIQLNNKDLLITYHIRTSNNYWLLIQHREKLLSAKGMVELDQKQMVGNFTCTSLMHPFIARI